MSGNIEPWSIWGKITDEGLAMHVHVPAVTLLTLGTKGYGSRFVVRSFVRSFVRSVHCATESSAHFFVPVKVRTG